MLSPLRRDFRVSLVPSKDRNRLVHHDDCLDTFFWYPLLHPMHLRSRILNLLSWPLFALYGLLPLGELKTALNRADLVIFESNPSLLLARRIRKLAPKARLVYRASDDLRTLRTHPIIVEAERRALPLFDMISVVTKPMTRLLAGSVWHGHGVEKMLFDTAQASPYQAGTRNAVFIGVTDYDEETVLTLADAFAGWTFHIIGPLPHTQERSNIVYHGEMRFEETVPFIRHADIGLSTRINVPTVAIYSDSLKMLQFTYCRLPILAPQAMGNNFGNLIGYEPGDRASTMAAFERAAAFDRSQARADVISSWDELAAKLMN